MADAARLRSHWVGVAVVGVLFLATTLLAVGRPGQGPSGLLDGLPELAVEDIRIDGQSGLPIVPLTDDVWWWLEAPAAPVAMDVRYTSAAPASSRIDPAQRQVTALAAFPDNAAAIKVAEALASAVGDRGAEAEFLVGHGHAGSGGFDWVGSAAATAPFVQVVDRWLLVSGLAYRPSFDDWAGSVTDGRPAFRSPLTLALMETADTVYVEGDRSGEGVIAFDASCTGEPAALGPLSQDLADGILVNGSQPVWLPPGITSEQRRARRTLRLLRQLQASAFARVLLEDGRFTELNRAAGAAASSGDAARIRAAVGDLKAYVQQALPAALPDLGPVAEALDPDVVAAQIAADADLAVAPQLESASHEPQTADDRRREAEPFGALQANVPWRAGTAWFVTGLEGRELSLGLGSWSGMAEGFGHFVDHLHAHGCEDLRITFHDYDDVRGD